MPYTKIVQYGNVTEVYKYEKNLGNHRKPHISRISKKRARDILRLKKEKGTYQRSNRSIKKSHDNFFRLCHHNNVVADSIFFFTITFGYEVTYKKAGRHVAHYMERIKKTFSKVPVRYISVPERTQKGRFHFHLLVYNLPTEEIKNERSTRNLQRQFQRGFLDIRHAGFTSKGLAGYMSKYMGKALADLKGEAVRGYNCSRNIVKYYKAGSNSLSDYEDIIVPTEGIVKTSQYDVPFMGRCHYKNITVKK